MVDRFSPRRADTILDKKDRHWVRSLYRTQRGFARRAAARLSRRSAHQLIKLELCTL